MPIDHEPIDRVFKMTDREVWIVTAGHPARRGGLLATWVMQASIDRQSPVVLVGIAPNHFTRELVDETGAFAAHLLRPDQIDLAIKFALFSGRQMDKLAGLDLSEKETGSPVIHDTLCWLDCRVFARLDAGDRVFFWADVVRGEKRDDSRPLTEWQVMSHADDQTRAQLLADRQSDVKQQRPKGRAWRDNLPVFLTP
ncbi:MAG: hypothetical protein CMJ59_07785 [Planctomycetaceae bacterium]|nr:hypothetical protein [Planctomycetaceae bacterium]